MNDKICINCLKRCDEEIPRMCDSGINSRHAWFAFDTPEGRNAIAVREHKAYISTGERIVPKPDHDPVCSCGHPMRLISTNTGITRLFHVPDPDEDLVTEKSNYQCYNCHATATFTRMNGDDPLHRLPR